MWSKLQQKIGQWQGSLITAPAIAVLVISGSLTGFFQLLEWATLDTFFRLRPSEPIESKIVIVSISDSDIEYFNKWPIDDATLAKSIEKIKQQKPAVIGLDLYRNIPVEPGYQELLKTFTSTPNLIGVEKLVKDRVTASTTLAKLDRVAMADLVLDTDGKVRRALIATQLANGETKLALGTKSALMYLEQKGITLEAIENSNNRKLGKAIFVPITGNDGGYVNVDAGGFQILLNFRGMGKKFQIVSIQDVLAGKIAPDLMRDRIVLIGSTASSLNDYFYTPYTYGYLNQKYPYRMAGVVVHANIISQIINAATEGRPMIQVLADPWEWSWIFCWSILGAITSSLLSDSNLRQKSGSAITRWIFIAIVFPGGTIVGIGYVLFLKGWWLPVISPLVASTSSAIFSAGLYYLGKQQLAVTDGLTQVANRYYFDKFLDKQWWRSTQTKKNLSLILCDVDFFKFYNDTYGHQSGDICLQKVASALSQCARSSDLVARYGGEEFVIILPDTNLQTAYELAEKICSQVRALRIVHSSSQVSPYVSLSCGVASLIANSLSSPASIVSAADRALYDAKKQGRDRVVMAE